MEIDRKPTEIETISTGNRETEKRENNLAPIHDDYDNFQK